MSIAIAETDYAPTPGPLAAPVPDPLIRRIWPQTVVGLGLSLSVAWTFFLGYGLVKLITLAI